MEWGTFTAFESACEAEIPWSAEPDVKLTSNWLWKMGAKQVYNNISQLNYTQLYMQISEEKQMDIYIM